MMLARALARVDRRQALSLPLALSLSLTLVSLSLSLFLPLSLSLILSLTLSLSVTVARRVDLLQETVEGWLPSMHSSVWFRGCVTVSCFARGEASQEELANSSLALPQPA